MKSTDLVARGANQWYSETKGTQAQTSRAKGTWMSKCGRGDKSKCGRGDKVKLWARWQVSSQIAIRLPHVWQEYFIVVGWCWLGNFISTVSRGHYRGSDWLQGTQFSTILSHLGSKPLSLDVQTENVEGHSLKVPKQPCPHLSVSCIKVEKAHCILYYKQWRTGWRLVNNPSE